MKRLSLTIVAALLIPFAAAAQYTPDKKSIAAHEIPVWYDNAKFGIMIHWGLYSVPAYAPAGLGDVNEVIAKHGLEFHFKNNPYAEWYLNTLRIPDSATREYHNAAYGADFPYDNFAPMFDEESVKWDPNAWAELFRDIGARYVVLVTKHHDGFTLWPSEEQNPNKKFWSAKRDIAGELTSAVRGRGLRLGLYYSGALDWSFTETPITGFATMYTSGPASKEYGEYVDFHMRELTDRYRPDILWNDIGYPPKGDLYGTVAYYYNQIPEGVINNRWMQVPARGRKLLTLWPLPKIFDAIAKTVVASGGLPTAPTAVGDYATPEYTTSKDISTAKFECVRGIGNSFGYNRMETEAGHLTPYEAVHLLVDVVSKNGNLLLNVGPRADGSIPEPQLRVLRGIGEWIKQNGEAIFGSRPWDRAEGTTAEGLDVRFTRKADTLYVIIFGAADGDLVIKNLAAKPKAKITILETGEPVPFEQIGLDLKVTLPQPANASPARVLAVVN